MNGTFGLLRMWHRLLFLLVVTGYVYTDSIYTTPKCHRGIMKLFRWCEQSECKVDCTCLSLKHVCKQICNERNCSKLYCSSPKTCYQNTLVEYRRPIPTVEKMVSHTPISQQDCTQANCKNMIALRYDKIPSKSFQSCSEGTCGNVITKADNAKQFCGNCQKMSCDGPHAKNCTQICVFGKCKDMYCNAKACKQVCTHESSCNLTCGPNTTSCEQSCSHGSTCTMRCQGPSCKQTCYGEKSCVKHSNITTTKATPPKLTTEKLSNEIVLPDDTSRNNKSDDGGNRVKIEIEIEINNDSENKLGSGNTHLQKSKRDVSSTSSPSSTRVANLFLIVTTTTYLIAYLIT